jgi:hypothetical protein
MPVRIKAAEGGETKIYANPMAAQGSSDRLPGGLYAEKLRFKRSDSAVGVVAAGASAVVNAHTAAGGNLVLLLIICTS